MTYIHETEDGRTLIEYRLRDHDVRPGILDMESRVLKRDGHPHTDGWYPVSAAEMTNLDRCSDIPRLLTEEARERDKEIAARRERNRTYPCFIAGDMVECIDAHHGCHFLVVGKRYIVESTQIDSLGHLRLNLIGMARAWEQTRFIVVERK